MVCPVQLHREVHPEMLFYVRYWRDLVLFDGAVALEGLWQHTMRYFPALPRDLHNCPLANYVTTPSSCFAEVESSLINVYINSWGCAAPSISKMLCNKTKYMQYIFWMALLKTLNYSTTHAKPPPHRTGTWYLSECIYVVLMYTGWHQYCIVNVKDCNTYLYIFTSKSFDPDTVSLKWDPVQLLHGNLVLYQDASDSGNAYSLYEYFAICKYFLL